MNTFHKAITEGLKSCVNCSFFVVIRVEDCVRVRCTKRLVGDGLGWKLSYIEKNYPDFLRVAESCIRYRSMV